MLLSGVCSAAALGFVAAAVPSVRFPKLSKVRGVLILQHVNERP